MTLEPWIRWAGGVMAVIAAANLLLPRRLRYRENLRRVEPIIRQIFIVHSAYIALLLTAFAALAVVFARELAGGSPLGRSLSAFLAAFWLPRIFIQRFYYDARLRKENRVVDLLFTAAFVYLAAVFAAAAVA